MRPPRVPTALLFDGSDAVANATMEEEGLLHNKVLGREEERVLAEALWSRPTIRIGALDDHL